MRRIRVEKENAGSSYLEVLFSMEDLVLGGSVTRTNSDFPGVAAWSLQFYSRVLRLCPSSAGNNLYEPLTVSALSSSREEGLIISIYLFASSNI